MAHELLITSHRAERPRRPDKVLTNPNDSAKERQTEMRPPSKRGTVVIPADQQRNNSIFKVSLRSWQAQYKARRKGRAPTGDEKLVAQAARN